MDIAVVGAGIAGLSAAWTLRRAGHRVQAFERNYKPGGRTNSRRKAGMIVDHGERFIMRQSPVIRELIFDCGLHGELAAIDQPIFHMNPDGSFREKPEEAVDLERVTFPGGMLMLPQALRRHIGGFNSMVVTSVEWLEDERKFVVHTDPPLRREATVHDGLVVACAAPEALRVCEPLRGVLNERFVERLEKVQYDSVFTLIAAVPVVSLPISFYGLYPPETPDQIIQWLAFEDRKCRGRAVPGLSSLVVHTTPRASRDLWDRKDEKVLERVYAEARRLVPELPTDWKWARAKRWRIGRLKGAGQVITHEDYPAASEKTPLEFAGDYRVGDGVEEAALSGRKAAEALLAKIAAVGEKKA